MKLKYAPATEEDRAFFIHVHHTAYRDTIEEMFGWDEKRQDELANRPFDEGGIHIIWHDDDRIGVVGWEERDDYIWLKELFLLPEYQSQGIGSQIIKDTITKARSDAKDVRLRTLKANMRAKELYERHGFVVTEATDIHWNMMLPYVKTEKIIVRQASSDDAEALLQVHYDSVQNVASADYSTDITKEWSKPIDEKRILDFSENPDNEVRLIAEIDGQTVGFGALVIEKHELRACYVSSRALRKGVGKALVQEIENIARENGLNYLQLDSSVTAEPFYLNCGYKITERGKHTMRNGMLMACVKMEKNL